MLAIRSNPKLKILFQLCKYSGLWIPEGKEEKKNLNRPTLWEAFLLLFAVTVLVFVIFNMLTSIANFKVVQFCRPGIVFLIYFNGISKALYLSLNRDKISSILVKMEEVINNSCFEKQQKNIIDFVCFKIRKTIFLQLVACILIVTTAAMLIAGTLYINSYHKAMHQNSTIAAEDAINHQFYRVEKFKFHHYVGFLMNSFCILTILLKNVSIDSLMFLCHYFIVQQLNLLRTNFTRPNKTFADEANRFNSWVTHLNKIKS